MRENVSPKNCFSKVSSPGRLNVFAHAQVCKNQFFMSRFARIRQRSAIRCMLWTHECKNASGIFPKIEQIKPIHKQEIIATRRSKILWSSQFFVFIRYLTVMPRTRKNRFLLSFGQAVLGILFDEICDKIKRSILMVSRH